MSERSLNETSLQVSLPTRIRALVLRGLLLVAFAAPVVAGEAVVASAHATVAPSHVIAPSMQCGGVPLPC